MSYVDTVICIGSLLILETWPPIYRGQERTVRDRLKASQVNTHVYFRYTPCLTDFTFEFIRRPISPILSPSSRTFVELTLINRINQELIAKHKKETAELWDDILSLYETTNKLQAQLYDLQNQNCEYEAMFKQMSVAASFRILETKSSFLDGEPLPWKSDDDKDSPPPPKE
jgi:hypothetical protein